MKKTSRRSFGKQLTGFLVSLPVVATAIQVKGQDQKDVGRPKTQEEIEKEHDTPPPVLIAEGSLTVETTSQFGGPVAAGQTRKKHFMGVGALRIAHIKILDGSGEMLYRNDKPRDAEVRVLVNDNTELKVARLSQSLYIDLPNDKDLGTPEVLGANSKRKARYRLKKTGNDLGLEAITVTENSDVNSPILFRVAKADLNSGLKEARIMIWLE